MSIRGVILAGGKGTRMGELTKVTNKHLLPVGAWPMIFYPLQLLQLAGIREVMIVTGQGHAGQLIDLLGNGRSVLLFRGIERGGAEHRRVPLWPMQLIKVDVIGAKARERTKAFDVVHERAPRSRSRVNMTAIGRRKVRVW